MHKQKPVPGWWNGGRRVTLNPEPQTEPVMPPLPWDLNLQISIHYCWEIQHWLIYAGTITNAREQRTILSHSVLGRAMEAQLLEGFQIRYKIQVRGLVLWLKPLVLDTWEERSGGLRFEASPGKKLARLPSQSMVGHSDISLLFQLCREAQAGGPWCWPV
jgi:hypothetical protein